MGVRHTHKYQEDPHYVLDRLPELEYRSHRNNLHIDGINEEKGKTWEISEIKVKNIFQEKLEIYKYIMERARRRKGKAN